MLLRLKFGLLDALLAWLLSLPYSWLMEREAGILDLGNMVATCIPPAGGRTSSRREMSRASVVHILVFTVLVMVPLCLDLDCFLKLVSRHRL